MTTATAHDVSVRDLADRLSRIEWNYDELARQASHMENLLRDVKQNWEDDRQLEEVVYRIEEYLRGIDGP
jgi:hypothetical protein